MSDELRDRIADVIEGEAFKWNIDFQLHMASPDQVSDPGPLAASQAQAIIDDLGLTIVDVPGGISDYSPFTGKPVVQPDRWYVDGERVFIREKQ